MSMMNSSLRRRAVGNRTVGPALAGLRLASRQHPVDPRLNVIAPYPGQAVGEGEDDGDEEAAEPEQPQFRKRLRETGLGEIDQQGAVDRAEDREPSTHGRVD